MESHSSAGRDAEEGDLGNPGPPIQPQEDQESSRPQREVRLTQRALESYDAEKQDLDARIQRAWDRVEADISEAANASEPGASIQRAIQRVKVSSSSYKLLANKYISLLMKMKTDEGLEGVRTQDNFLELLDDNVQAVIQDAIDRVEGLRETRSQHSVSSRSTTRSKGSAHSKTSFTSMAAAQARAAAEAANARIAYMAEEEAMLIEKARIQEEASIATAAARRKAEHAEQESILATAAAREQESILVATATWKKIELDAKLSTLQLKKEAAAARAQAEVLQAAANLDKEEKWSEFGTQIPVKDRDQLTRKNILDWSEQCINAPPPNDTEQMVDVQASPSPHRMNTNAVYGNGGNAYPALAASRRLSVAHVGSEMDASRQTHIPDSHIRGSNQRDRNLLGPPSNTIANDGMQGNAANNGTSQAPVWTHPGSAGLGDFARYLAHRELINTGLVKFDDHSENYRAWRSTFRNAIRNADICASKELDLLVKWLGNESTEYAKRIRAANIDDPASSLHAVWERLEECYGSPETIEKALFKKLQNFPKISGRDNKRLRELGDLLMELESAQADPYLPGLIFLNTYHGVNPIVEKLPFDVQEQWRTAGSRYKSEHQVAFPPFSFFSKFIRNLAKTRNDPSFMFGTTGISSPDLPKMEIAMAKQGTARVPISVHKTEVSPTTFANSVQTTTTKKKIEDPEKQCPLHDKPHSLQKCREFRRKPLEERKNILKEFGVCLKCCASTNHLARNCKADMKCEECGSDKHATVLHTFYYKPSGTKTSDPEAEHGGEQGETAALTSSITTKCTEVCGEGFKGRSCSKICLVRVYPKGHPERAVRMYAIMDDQSNKSLARSEFFDQLGVGGNSFPYTLRTCSGLMETAGRRAGGLMVETMDSTMKLALPTVTECNEIPDDRSEIPTPEVARHHPHLKPIAEFIPPLDHVAQILLLLGRDMLRVHKVRDQHNGPHDAPYTQRLDLGWVIVGDVCLDGTHKPDHISTFRTSVLTNGRTSLFKPCPNHFTLKEKFDDRSQGCTMQADEETSMLKDDVGHTVFVTTKDDDKPAPSLEDKEFLKIMDREFFQDESNSWVAPLPFRNPRCRLPNNRE
ncbi:uncharacterized protein LOC142925100 [Petromyzon marinus]|uniref:uncharacterized protein LOC142925100 n=1 Tax=Petromyzon marinus TaxID=7757 RepID=UPI003F722A07